jgi:hypothetical protein
MTTPKSLFVIRHSLRTALSLRRASYAMTPHPQFHHPVHPRLLPHLFIHYLYNGPARTFNEATQYSTSSTSVIITTVACSSTLGMPVTGRLFLRNIRNIVHFQIRLHRILHTISTGPSLPVSSFSMLSSVSHILYGPPTILKTRA